MGHPQARTRGAFSRRCERRTLCSTASDDNRWRARSWELQRRESFRPGTRAAKCRRGAGQLRVSLDSRPPRRTCSRRDTFAETWMHQCSKRHKRTAMPVRYDHTIHRKPGVCTNPYPTSCRTGQSRYPGKRSDHPSEPPCLQSQTVGDELRLEHTFRPKYTEIRFVSCVFFFFCDRLLAHST
jgi:hypothetical protein